MRKKQAKENKPTSNKNISSSTRLPLINNKKTINSPNHNLSVNVSSYQDEGLITLLQEYLLKNNLFDTLDTFQRDCLKGFKQSIKSVDALKKELLQYFDMGHRDAFSVKFTQFVPLSMRTKDSKTLKMQFYTELYFYIYSIHPFLGKKKNNDAVSKQNFVSYLEGRGSILSKQQQFLPFYALAYLQKPQQHQTFKSMFTKQWIQDLRKELIFYIEKLYPATKTPTIVSIYDKFIEFNLQAEKFSSVALTEPDEEYDDNAIEQKIEENLEESIINNPQPVLLENNNNSNKMLNNNSEKNQKNNSPNQQVYLNGSFNSNNSKSPQLTDKEREELLQLRQRASQFQEEKAGYLSYIQTLTKRCQSSQNDRKEFSESVKIILQESQNKWFKLIQQVYGLALDVFNTALTLNDGEPLSDPNLLVKRGQQLQRYKGFVNMNIEDLLSDNVADYSLFERPEHDFSVDMVKKNTEYFEKDQKLIEIDFDRIKGVLATVPDSTMSESDIKELQFEKCLILQALRWRMTRVRGAFQKREVVISYTKFDVLEVNEGQKRGERSVIRVLLSSQNLSIVHQTTLLISVLGIDYYGRQYLHESQLMIKLMELRKNPSINGLIKGTILVIFQILSNKRSCQAIMIDNGLMEEVVQILDKERDQMPPFIMEYTAALLLNLLLNKKGLDRAEPVKSYVLMTLINLMQTEYPSVKSFVYASLYPMLARQSFRQKALEFGMQANIKYLLQNNPTLEVQHQLGYVYNRLMMEGDLEEVKDEEPQYDEINDEQIGEEAQLIHEQINSSLSGELLLMKKYSLTGPDAIKQIAMARQQVRDTFTKAIYYDRQTYERYSVQTPLLGKGRKSQIVIDKGGFTNNNSVYSNKSTNRILRSQKNSRIKNPTQPNEIAKQKQKQKQKQKENLDGPHQKENEKKDYPQKSKEEEKNQNRFQEKKNQNKLENKLLENDSFQHSKQTILPSKNKALDLQNVQGTFRTKEKKESPLKGSLIQEFNSQQSLKNQSARIINQISFQNNESMTEKLNRQNEEQANLRNRKLKPYEQGEEYVKAFQTRALLVRTPPQKPN